MRRLTWKRSALDAGLSSPCPQEPQRCIIGVIATLMNDALIWKVEKDGEEREEESSVPLGGHLRLKGCPVHLTYF